MSAQFEKSYSLTPFGELCRDARVRMTMTKPELARMVGTSPLDISKIERGEKPPTAQYVTLVMGILGLDQADLEAVLSTHGGEYKLTRIAQPRYGME